MENFRAELELSEALGLFLVLRDHADDERVQDLNATLRDYLYAHLSIEEMEEPELFYERLRGGPRARGPTGAPRSSAPAARSKR